MNHVKATIAVGLYQAMALAEPPPQPFAQATQLAELQYQIWQIDQRFQRMSQKLDALQTLSPHLQNTSPEDGWLDEWTAFRNSSLYHLDSPKHESGLILRYQHQSQQILQCKNKSQQKLQVQISGPIVGVILISTALLLILVF